MRGARNTKSEIHMLEPVKSLREVWPNEARNFTPWLAKNITRLGATLNLNLKDVETEKTLSGAGRVDIYAQEEETNAPIVIENQLGWSDDGHCLRLLGYAASAEASILVWVAGGFTSYHRSILKWLNETGKVDVYAVAVRAYHAGETLGLSFETVVEPDPLTEEKVRPTKRTLSTICAEFYRPVVKQLRQKGMRTMGIHSWAGRYRSFQSGLNGSLYGSRVVDGVAQVFLRLGGGGGHPEERFNALKQKQTEIDCEIEGTVSWLEEGELSWVDRGAYHILLENKGSFRLTDPKEGWEPMRQWVSDSLFKLWDVLEPRLEKLRQEEEAIYSN